MATEVVPEENLAEDNIVQNCFSEVPFDKFAVSKEGNKRFDEGFVMWLPDSFIIRESNENNYEQGDYVIESLTGHKAEINFVNLRSEVLRSRKMHSPSIVFEPISNTWWFDNFYGESAAGCLPNSTGVTKVGDPIYLTQDGDVGAFFKVFTLVSNKRLKQPEAGYADAIQIKFSGNANDPSYQSYEEFEEIVLKILYNTEATVTKG